MNDLLFATLQVCDGLEIYAGDELSPYLEDRIAQLRSVIAAYDAQAPDWSQAPDWAGWSVIHANGLRYWMEKQPSWQHGDVGWDRNGGKQEFDFDCDKSLPLGVDWRLCKWQRPEVAA